MIPCAVPKTSEEEHFLAVEKGEPAGEEVMAWRVILEPTCARHDNSQVHQLPSPSTASHVSEE